MQKIVITVDATAENLAILNMNGVVDVASLVESGKFPAEVVAGVIRHEFLLRRKTELELIAGLGVVVHACSVEVVEPGPTKAKTPSPSAPPPPPQVSHQVIDKPAEKPAASDVVAEEAPPFGYKSAPHKGLVAIDWWTPGAGPVEAFNALDADIRLKHWALLTEEVQKWITAARKPLGSASPAKVKPAAPSPPPPETSTPAETSAPVDIVPAGYSQALPAGTEPVPWLDLAEAEVFKAYTALTPEHVLVHWHAMTQVTKDLVGAAIKAHDDPITKRAVAVRAAWNEQATPADKLNWAMRVQAGLPNNPIEMAREHARWVIGDLINEITPEVLEKYALALGEWRLANGYGLPMKPTPAPPVSKRPKARGV